MLPATVLREMSVPPKRPSSAAWRPEQLAARFIALIGELYHVEAQARRDGVDIAELGRRRQQQSVPALADIEALLLANVHAVLPKSLLGQCAALPRIAVEQAQALRR